MMTATIEYGHEYWKLHTNGQIERPGWVKPSDSWRIVGAVERNNFGNVVRRYSLAEVLAGKVTKWRNKNGTQRTFVRDFDHGTIREWQSPCHRVLP